MSETPDAEKPDVEITAADLFEKRITSAARLMMRYLMTGCPVDHELRLYSLNIGADLTESERGALAAMLLSTFPPDQAEMLCRAWFQGAGFPSAQIMDDPMQDAKFWAGNANAKELDAYAVCSFNRMSPRRKAEFLKWAQSKVDANG